MFYNEGMISCILLTAGESQRFGSPKALAQIHQSTAIEILQEKLVQSLVTEIIIVTGAHENLIKPYVFNHSKVSVVYNKDYKFGQTSSFQKGIGAANNNSNGLMLLPVDCPFVSTQSINQLLETFLQEKPVILIPSFKGKRGHPPIFNNDLKETILKLDVHQGLNDFMREQKIQTLEIADPGLVQTFNTEEELNKILIKNL